MTDRTDRYRLFTDLKHGSFATVPAPSFVASSFVVTCHICGAMLGNCLGQENADRKLCLTIRCVRDCSRQHVVSNVSNGLDSVVVDAQHVRLGHQV